MKRITPVRNAGVLVLLAVITALAPGTLPAQAERRLAHAPGTKGAPGTSFSANQLANQAAQALFGKSDLDGARTLARAALHAARKGRSGSDRQNSAEVEALFVEMEAAALAADTTAELDAALRLCELRRANKDARINIAAARILELAANTAEFRAAVPQLQKLVSSGGPQTNYLRAALLAAAADGAPGLSVPELARQSGLITDWRVAGPFGKYPNTAFERAWAPERDGLSQREYDGHTVESFRFEDGNFALADYFSTAGIFYAAAELTIPATGEWRLRVESAGTLQVFLDGVSVLEKDDRFRATPEIASRAVRLSNGVHRVLVKLLPAAAPLRIAFLPSGQDKPAPRTDIAYELEAAYVYAAGRYWSGDYANAIAQLDAMRKQQETAMVDFLLAQAWAHSAQDPPEGIALLTAALAAAPAALAAEYELAAHDYDQDHAEEALRRLRRVVAARAEFAPAQHLMAQAAVRLNWSAEAAPAVEADIRLHPSCGALRKAAKFFSGIAAYDRAAKIEQQLDGCAPGSLAYAEALGDSGRHVESADAAAGVVAARPLDREARALLVRELALAGKLDAASHAAGQLVKLAPNAAQFQRLAPGGGGLVLDQSTERGRELLREQPFYAAQRRDGFRIVQQTAHRRFSGGPAVVLLEDRVARVGEDGSVSLYLHKITRVLDREGIEKYGEVTLPRSADLLELRTIKAGGTFAEPEFSQHKASISMPALAPGDAIEQEYVMHYADVASAERAGLLQFTFGSFTAPILYARFAVLSPAKTDTFQLKASPSLPGPATRSEGGTLVRIWEKESIPQSVEEPSAPSADLLPSVRIFAERARQPEELRDFYRDELISALRAGSRVEGIAAELRKSTQEETVRAMYRWVAAKIRNAEGSFAGGDVAPVESTLAAFSGSRTAALLGLAEAAGIEAELLLGREVGRERSSDAYTYPMVRFRILEANGGSKEIVVDAEKNGVALGALPATISREDVLRVPLPREEAKAAATPSIIQLPASSSDEQSLADGDVWFDKQGNLSARVQIRMGTSRSAQMRWILSAIDPGERKHFFEQLAARIFPGASDANGEVRNEFEPDDPLELLLFCRASNFVDLTAEAADMEQLVPALGLRKMYLAVDPRHFPLYVDAPLFETATFRVHLPQGVRVTAQASDLHLHGQFGDYSVDFRQPEPDQIEIRRAFRIPVQVVAPDGFAAFSRFARQIDDAERQRLTLAHAPNL